MRSQNFVVDADNMNKEQRTYPMAITTKGQMRSILANLDKTIEKAQRTNAQNNSLHLYCQRIADALNTAGYSIPEVLKCFKMEIPFTKENVKELLWRTAQKRMYNKESTTALLKQGEIDDIVDVMNRFLGENFHIEYIPFPNLSELENNPNIK